MSGDIGIPTSSPLAGAAPEQGMYSNMLNANSVSADTSGGSKGGGQATTGFSPISMAQTQAAVAARTPAAPATPALAPGYALNVGGGRGGDSGGSGG